MVVEDEHRPKTMRPDRLRIIALVSCEPCTMMLVRSSSKVGSASASLADGPSYRVGARIDWTLARSGSLPNTIPIPAM